LDRCANVAEQFNLFDHAFVISYAKDHSSGMTSLRQNEGATAATHLLDQFRSVGAKV